MVGAGRKAVPALVVAALLQQNPFMFYFGQEWGEHGMDSEGFSGHDGRTTIFDYWSLSPSKGDAALKAIYQRVLNIARSEKAVNSGQTFDLMYVNQQYYRQYAFLRKAGKELLLVVVNFDDSPVDMQLSIPDHAYDYLEIQERAYEAHELLAGGKQSMVLIKGEPVRVALESRGAVVMKLS